MGQLELNQVRKTALSFPNVNERSSHGAPCFFINDKQPLCYYHDDHRGDQRISVWFPATEQIQEILISPDQSLFFRPDTGASGAFRDWVGMWLDVPNQDQSRWHDLAIHIEDAFRRLAHKRLIVELDRRQSMRG